jgi:ABC-type ribose transport system, auxiliary component
MKKTGVLNSQLSGYIAALGHTDLFLIGDAGMPVPPGIPIVDLALCNGVPSFEQVFKTVLTETQIEYFYLSEETPVKNPKVMNLLQTQLPGIGYEFKPHVEIKEMTKRIKFAIRTGEFTPFANVILRAGVAFPV